MFRKTKVCHLIELKWTEFTQILKHIYRYSEWNWQKVCFEHHFIYLQGILSFIQKNSFEMKGITYRGRKYYQWLWYISQWLVKTQRQDQLWANDKRVKKSFYTHDRDRNSWLKDTTMCGFAISCSRWRTLIGKGGINWYTRWEFHSIEGALLLYNSVIISCTFL